MHLWLFWFLAGWLDDVLAELLVHKGVLRCQNCHAIAFAAFAQNHGNHLGETQKNNHQAADDNDARNDIVVVLIVDAAALNDNLLLVAV